VAKDKKHLEDSFVLWSTVYCVSYTHALAHASSRPPSSPPSFVSHQHWTFIGLPHPDHVTSQGRDSALAQHRDNDSHTSPSLRPSSVVVTSDPADISTMVVTSEHREVQHTTVLCHLYKNDAFCPIPTSSCVLAFIANNKGTFNPPALQSAFQKISLSLSLACLFVLRLRSLVFSLVSVVAITHALRQSLTFWTWRVNERTC
jgi:putative flippase GtrA